MMAFGFVGMFLFWGVLLALLAGGTVLTLRQTTTTRSPGQHGRSTARQILDARLARGEISREEYHTIRSQIGQ